MIKPPKLEKYPHKYMRCHTPHELNSEAATELFNRAKRRCGVQFHHVFPSKHEFFKHLRKPGGTHLSPQRLKNMWNTDAGDFLNTDEPRLHKRQRLLDLWSDSPNHAVHNYRYKRVWQAMRDKKRLPYPTVLKTTRGLHLLGGNHRLTAAAANNKILPVKIIDVRPKMSNLDRKVNAAFKTTAKPLTTEKRNALPDSDFVFPSKRAFPIADESHAKNALARASAMGAMVKNRVFDAVYRRYPELRKSGSKLMEHEHRVAASDDEKATLNHPAKPLTKTKRSEFLGKFRPYFGGGLAFTTNSPKSRVHVIIPYKKDMPEITITRDVSSGTANPYLHFHLEHKPSGHSKDFWTKAGHAAVDTIAKHWLEPEGKHLSNYNNGFRLSNRKSQYNENQIIHTTKPYGNHEINSFLKMPFRSAHSAIKQYGKHYNLSGSKLHLYHVPISKGGAERAHDDLKEAGWRRQQNPGEYSIYKHPDSKKIIGVKTI